MDEFNNVCMIFFIIYIGQVINISNEILLENSVVLSSVCQKYTSLRKYDQNGEHATWNAVSDVLMWIKTKNRSLQGIQYHGCHAFNTTAEREVNNTFFEVEIGTTSFSIQICVNKCNTIDQTLGYFGLKDSTCHCFRKKLRISNALNHSGRRIKENCCYGINTLMLYSRTNAEADNTTYRMKLCAAIQLTPDGDLTFLKINCSIELPYVCIRCDENRSIHVMDTHDKWVESSMDCIKGIENTTNQLSNKTYWVVIPRNEQDLKKNGDAESTCIVTTFSKNITSPVIKDCRNMMCNNTEWKNKSPSPRSNYFCSTRECIIYLSISVTGFIGITVFVVLVCNTYRNRKKVRIKEPANRTVEEIQLDDMPTASSYLYEEHFDVDINQINQTESNEVNNAENEISGSKSKLKEDAIRQNKKSEKQAVAENEYNSLNHTLWKPDNAASNAVYDKVKPAIITLIRGEQFVGTEYDSVDVLKRNTNTHLAKL
ncbi:uncharacterized protein [Mytilus edulis]|uniref:uncharacterized protein n=1 Tax=Mytilus edulis TaxID=6550 RepID=UPI0039EF9B17